MERKNGFVSPEIKCEDFEKKVYERKHREYWECRKRLIASQYFKQLIRGYDPCAHIVDYYRNYYIKGKCWEIEMPLFIEDVVGDLLL